MPSASLLFGRAAQDKALSPAEREACLSLADELEHDAQPEPMINRLQSHRRHASPVSRAATF